MRTLHEIQHQFPVLPENGLTAARPPRAGEQLRRQQADAAAARTAVEEVPRKVRRADHQDPARRGPAVDVRRSVPGRPGGWPACALAVVAASSAARWPSSQAAHWVPSILFVSAIVVFFVGLLAAHHPSVEGLAVMVAVILATGVAFLSEYKSDREFEVLNAQKDSLQRQAAPRRRHPHGTAGGCVRRRCRDAGDWRRDPGGWPAR